MSRFEREVLSRLDEILKRVGRLEREVTTRVVREAYTVQQAAEHLGKSKWSVRQACNQGRIRGRKAANGCDWLIDRAELLRVEAEGFGSTV